jgi:hypothetical protein
MKSNPEELLAPNKTRLVNMRAVALLLLTAASGVLAGCQPSDAVQIVNKTDIPVRVTFRVLPKYAMNPEVDMLIENGSFGRLAIDEIDDKECVTPVIEAAPGYTPKGDLWTPNSTWCNNSSRIDKWVIEYKPA